MPSLPAPSTPASTESTFVGPATLVSAGGVSATSCDVSTSIDASQRQVGELLSRLQEAAPSQHVEAVDPSIAKPEQSFENQLAVVRLGMASSLFYALRTKHAATAAHSLRVALSCSAWAERMGLASDVRDRIEVAALLHDIGKIGIPDRVLRKPGKLTVDERLTMDLTPQLGVEILRGCTGDADLLDIVSNAHRWFQSRRDESGAQGEALPLGARMLSIAGAFDSMTTDTVYRPALSREAALGELFSGSGSQFDPELTEDFVRMLEDRPELLQGAVVHRWLHSLRDGGELSIWSSHASDNRDNRVATDPIGKFFSHWFEHSKDGVIFLDHEGCILRWNTQIARMTGIAGETMVGQLWDESAIRLRMADEDQQEHAGLLDRPPIRGEVHMRDMLIEQPGRIATPIEVQMTAVSEDNTYAGGYLIVVRDLSEESDLQAELDTLQLKSTLDPLTKVANRSHFDDTLAELTESASRSKQVFSLVICDIDHFKKVNDIHGHQAGDEALIGFAEVLREHSREGDLVARYGGEEFLLLTRNCDNATATRRAEAIRVALETRALPSLNNESVTASFGVTQFQSGDSPETVVARADRALLKAKENGRNRVIQLGGGGSFEVYTGEKQTGWRSLLPWNDQKSTEEFDIVTPVPTDLVIEKLRGFIADHDAEIVRVDENQVTVRINVTLRSSGRRRSDQQIAIQASLTLAAQKPDPGSRNPTCKTNVHVILSPIRNRDRRGRPLQDSFTQVTNSLRSYLMGEMVHPRSR